MQTSKNVFAISRVPQVDYNTPLVPAMTPKNYEQVVKQGYGFANLSTTVATNEGYSTGTPNPTTVDIDRHDAEFSLNERMTAQRLGRRATAAMGLPVSTPVAGSTGATRHIFVPLNPQAESNLPVYSYVEKHGEPASSGDITDDRMLPSAAMESINFESGGSDAYLNGASNWRGSGKVIEPSGVTFGTGANQVLLYDAAAENSIKAGQADVKIYPSVSLGGTPITIGCDFRSVSMGYTTGLIADAGYIGCAKYQTTNDPNSGSVRGNMPSGNPQITLSFTLVKSIGFAQSFNPLTKMRAQTQFSVAFSYIGGLIPGITGTAINFLAKFKYFKLTVASVTQGDENGAQTFEITTLPLSVGNSYPLELELVNNISSYATLV